MVNLFSTIKVLFPTLAMLWEVTHTIKRAATKYLHQQKNSVKQNQTVYLKVDIC